MLHGSKSIIKHKVGLLNLAEELDGNGRPGPYNPPTIYQDPTQETPRWCL